MTDEHTVSSTVVSAQPSSTSSLTNPLGQHKTDPRLSKPASRDALYPSPPMSTSQSPPQPHSEPPPSTVDNSESFRGSTHTAPTTPALSTGPSPTFSDGRSQDVASAPASIGPGGSTHSLLPQSSMDNMSFKVLPSFPSQPPALGSVVPSTRTGRKSKAHVASACINCKRAHLSCDVQRPCQRCVSSGKQDTCHDVAHKKRGRPRLREDNGARNGENEQRSQVLTSGGSQIPPPGSRPIATPRLRRTDSHRSHSSLAVQAPSNKHSSYPPTYDMRPAPYQPTYTSILPPADIPTAFCDLDLVVLRANRPFKQIMSNGAEVTGLHLSQLAISLDAQRFTALQAALTAEKDTREPSYLPPIVAPGQDHLHGVSELDVDRLTHGFEDRTHTWARNDGRPMLESFPARVRLGKALSYFVVVTLPSFRPYLPMSGGNGMAPQSAGYAVAPPPPHQHQSIMSIHSPSPYNSHYPPAAQHHHQPSMRYGTTYPPSHYSPSTHQMSSSGAAPRLPPPSTEQQAQYAAPHYHLDKPPYYPHGRPSPTSSADLAASPVGLGVQLPPIGKRLHSPPHMHLGPFSRSVQPAYHTSSPPEDVDEAERFGVKRRRVGMGIDEVLQP